MIERNELVMPFFLNRRCNAMSVIMSKDRLITVFPRFSAPGRLLIQTVLGGTLIRGGRLYEGGAYLKMLINEGPIGVYKKVDADKDLLVGHIPMELSLLLKCFLDSDKENGMIAEVTVDIGCGKMDL